MLKFAVTSDKVRPAEGRISPLNRVIKKPRILSERIDNTDHSENPESSESSESSENSDSDKLSCDSSIQLLFQRHKVLQKAHEDFDSFLEVVSKDMLTKTKCLKKVKNSNHVGISNKTEANLQLFMLSQYNHRITR